MTRLHRRTQQILALGLALLLIAGLWRLVFDPLRVALGNVEREITETKEALSIHRRIIATGAPLRQRLEAVQQKASPAAETLSAGSAELAAAELQRRVLEKVEDQGGTVESTEILPPQTTEFFRKVSVRVTLTTDLATLQAIVHALEIAKPLLFVDGLDVRRRNPEPTRVSRVAPLDMQLSLIIHAYMEGSEP